MDAPTKALRLCQIAESLRNGETLTPAKVADTLGVSRRTAQRYLGEVDLLVPVVVVSERKTGDGWQWRIFRKEDI